MRAKKERNEERKRERERKEREVRNKGREQRGEKKGELRIERQRLRDREMENKLEGRQGEGTFVSPLGVGSPMDSTVYPIDCVSAAWLWPASFPEFEPNVSKIFVSTIKVFYDSMLLKLQPLEMNAKF